MLSPDPKMEGRIDLIKKDLNPKEQKKVTTSLKRLLDDQKDDKSDL